MKRRDSGPFGSLTLNLSVSQPRTIQGGTSTKALFLSRTLGEEEIAREEREEGGEGGAGLITRLKDGLLSSLMLS